MCQSDDDGPGGLKPKPTTICPICGLEFVAILHGTQKFCSVPCAQEHYYGNSQPVVAGGQGRSGVEILAAGFGIMSIVGFAIAAAAVGGILWLALAN